MKLKLNKIAHIILSCAVILTLQACGDSNKPDPNQIAGDGNLPQNKVGSEYGADVTIDGISPNVSFSIKDSIRVTKNNNGNLEVIAKITFSSKDYLALDTALGLSTMPIPAKIVLLDTYKKKYGFNLDSTDHNRITVDYKIKGKMTTEGIQDYVISRGDESKPFTIIKYGAKVGDKYTFKDVDGEEFIRTVTHIDTDNTFPLVFLKIKITKTEQVSDNPLTSKIVYYTNHKFGLVKIEVHLKTGKVINLKLVPWANPGL